MDQLDRLDQWLQFLPVGRLDLFLLADLLNLWLRLLQLLPVGRLDRLVQWLRFLLEDQLGLLDLFLLEDQLGRLDLFLLVAQLDQ